jgi:beta-ribofuranosylaminobenzene 5'-phosphate synthase
MTRVETGSRLHFGLLNPACEPGVRRFGGAGLMIDQPRLSVTVTAAHDWSATGPLARRALALAQRFTETLPPDVPRSFRVAVHSAPPEHSGLGVGTQLGLAVARACALEAEGEVSDLTDLCRRVGRGLRSGLGAHGFVRGGFLVDGGKIREEDLAPLIAWHRFPEEWRVVVFLADEQTGLNGAAERAAFDRLAGCAEQTPSVLCRLVLLGLLPALAERDIRAFGEALYEFNRRVGETFAVVQGGPYVSSRVAEAIAFLRHEGVAGVGQSSWGPAVFAIVEDRERAAQLIERLRGRYGETASRMWVAAAQTGGAAAERIG